MGLTKKNIIKRNLLVDKIKLTSTQIDTITRLHYAGMDDEFNYDTEQQRLNLLASYGFEFTNEYYDNCNQDGITTTRLIKIKRLSRMVLIEKSRPIFKINF